MYRCLIFFAWLSLVYSVPLKIKVKSDKSHRIVGGEDTHIEKIPYQLSFGALTIEQEYEHECGASLLKPGLVLTAAHCTQRFAINDDDDAVIFGGITRLSEIEEGLVGPDQFSYVMYIRDHENFDRETLKNDIALLYLVDDLQLSSKLQPVKLPTHNVDSGTMLLVGGWGLTKSNGEPSDMLKSVEVPVISDAQCHTYYPNLIQESTFCAGYPEGMKDSCNGDSGGALSDFNGVQYGIVSWGEDCGIAGHPGVYVKLLDYLPWIKKHENND